MKTIVFLPIGYPTLDASMEIAELYVQGGCDAVEIGFPVPDAYMDNDLIKSAMGEAFAANADYEAYLKSVELFRNKHKNIQIILMLYRYAIEKISLERLIEFCMRNDIHDIVSGDMKDARPTERLAENGVHIAGSCNFSLEEIKIEQCLKSKGFVYMVSQPQSGQKFRDGCDSLEKCIRYLRKRGVNNKIYCGMGIKTPQDALTVKKAGADGFFVGSSIISLYKEPERLVNYIHEFSSAAVYDLEMVLAVGGGSSIDTAKAVACGVKYDGDISELVNVDYRGEVLPILTILTMSGSGTEMTTSTVLNNEETKIKRGWHGPDLRPRISFLNPEFTFTAPVKQTAAGVADGISHCFESYFSNITGAYLQARFGEAIISTLFEYGETAVKDPENYEARANVMLANTWACNGVIVKGNYVYWCTHIIEHQMSAIDENITHGVGLAIITPPWMRWALNDDTAFRYVDLGVRVFGLDPTLPAMEIANKTIEITEDFFYNKLGLPSKLSDIGITEENIQDIADRCEKMLTPAVQKIMFKPATRQDIVDILHACK